MAHISQYTNALPSTTNLTGPSTRGLDFTQSLGGCVFGLEGFRPMMDIRWGRVHPSGPKYGYGLLGYLGAYTQTLTTLQINWQVPRFGDFLVLWLNTFDHSRHWGWLV